MSELNQPLVSVIVPVYNVSEYLEECFNSISQQTYQRLEIILVDDGSTDSSGELCDKLALKDSRALVIHKENAGLSEARNTGLRLSNGDWIAFVDSDDYVSPIFIESLLNAALDYHCKISRVPSGIHFEDGNECVLANETEYTREVEKYTSYEVQRKLLYQEFETGYQWHFFSREILGDDPCPAGLIFEDLASIYRLIHKVDCVAVVQRSDLYAYRLRASGLLHQKYRHEKGSSALLVADQLSREISEWYPELKVAASSRCFSVCRLVFSQTMIADGADAFVKEDRAELWNILKKHRMRVLCDQNARKRERLAALFACGGRRSFSVFCKLSRIAGKM